VKRSATTVDLLSRLMLAIVASIAILQTPVPMAHVHSEIGSQGLLSEHLVRHHHRNIVDANEVHWHLVLPGTPHDSEQAPTSELPSPSALACGSAMALGVGFDSLPLDQVFELAGATWPRPPVPMLREPRSTPPPAQLASSRRVRALLCVIRC